MIDDAVAALAADLPGAVDAWLAALQSLFDSRIALTRDRKAVARYEDDLRQAMALVALEVAAEVRAGKPPWGARFAPETYMAEALRYTIASYLGAAKQGRGADAHPRTSLPTIDFLDPDSFVGVPAEGGDLVELVDAIDTYCTTPEEREFALAAIEGRRPQFASRHAREKAKASLAAKFARYGSEDPCLAC